MKKSVCFIFTILIFAGIVNGQISWESVNPPSVGIITKIEIGPDNEIFIITREDEDYFTPDSLYYSLNGGSSWNHIDVGTDAINDIFISCEGEFYIGAGQWGIGGGEPPGGIFYSTDGVDWENIHKGQPGCGHIYKVYKNLEGDILASTDGGDLWQLIANEPDWVLLCSCNFVINGCSSSYEKWKGFFEVKELFIDKWNHYYMSTTRGGFKSNDKGLSWKNLGLSYEINYIEINENEDIIAATPGNGLFINKKDTDQWESIGLTGKDIFKIYSQGDSILIAVSKEDGIFLTRNDGNSWNQFNEGLEKTTIRSISVSPSGFFYISTGTNIYKSNESFSGVYTNHSSTGNQTSSINASQESLLKNIYPNPANTILTIETNNSDYYSLEVTSLNGQEIYNTVMEGTTHQMDISSFPKGVYFITIRSTDSVRTEKIVKL